MAADGLESLLRIPGNHFAFEQARELLERRQAVAFIGAGASAPLYPLWEQLIAEMADAAVTRGLADRSQRDFWVLNAATDPLQMAGQIRQRLQDGRYFALLYETFKQRSGGDGQPFTSAQRAIMALNFKGVITTNYDEGLVQAKHVVRPNFQDGGFTVWNQKFRISLWLSGTALLNPGICPVLFAHGHFADPENLILDRDSYRQAYQGTPYGQLARELWHRERLIFAGFSFKDEVLKHIADQDLWKTVRQGGDPSRHVAILGLSGEAAYTPEMRLMYLERFCAEVLFYPVTKDAMGRPDHTALTVLLTKLAEQGGGWQAPAPVITSTAALPAATESPLKFRCVHETTEDEKFTGREAAIARLDAWAADSMVRIVAISAIGGTGKTALLATWMRRRETARLRQFAAVFFWSFYRNHSAAAFLQTLLDFGRSELAYRWPEKKAESKAERKNIPLVEQAAALLQQLPVLIGLDGLEVIQEDLGSVDYGKVLDPELASFLDRLAYASSSASMVVLTSRYPFPDLTPFLGNQLRLLPLPALERSEGATLLHSMGVGGDDTARSAISERLEGHPLALRLFARSMGDNQHNPDAHWDLIYSGAAQASDPLSTKMSRLLTFYADHLPSELRETLGLVALFHTLVAESVLRPLWVEVLGHSDPQPALSDCLEVLRRDHLLTADPDAEGVPQYTAHPILRDYFRDLLLGRPGFVHDASKLLSERPGSTDDLEQSRFLLVAAELAASQGKVASALQLVDMAVRTQANYHAVERVTAAGTRALQRTAVASHDSAALLILSVISYHHLGRQDDIRKVINRMVANGVAVDRFGSALCEFTNAIAYGGLEARQLSKTRLLDSIDPSDDLFPLLELAHWSMTGHCEIKTRRWAVNLASSELHVLQLLGGLSCAAIESLLKANYLADAKQLLEQIFGQTQDPRQIFSNTAVADYLRAWIAFLEGNLVVAHAALLCARNVFAKAPMVYELAKLHLLEARLELHEGDHAGSLVAVEAALRIAARRKYRLIHADALALRAAACLAGPKPDASSARDAAEAALSLAEQCMYRWGERDAHQQLAAAAMRLHQPGAAEIHQRKFELLNKQLVLPSGFEVVSQG